MRNLFIMGAAHSDRSTAISTKPAHAANAATKRRARRFALAMIGTSMAGGLATGAHATTYVWSSGDYVAGTTSPSPLLTGDFLSIQGSASKNFATNFTNQSGEVDWLDGFLALSGNTITNNSLWRALNTTTVNYTGGTFVNNGIFRKEGTGDFLVRGGFVNNGTIDAAVGTINYKGGVTFNNGTIFTGAGTNQLVFDAKFNGAISSTNLLLNGGIQTGTGASLSGTARLAGSRMAGDWTIADGSTFAIIGDSTIADSFTNNGTVKQGAFLSFDSANVVNNSLWLVNSSTTTNFNGGTLVNNGILRNEGTADFLIRGGLINNGTIDAAGGTINYKGGITFNSGTVFTGAFNNQLVFDAKFNGAISSTNLLLNGGIQTGTGAVLTGTARLAGSRMAGDWTIADGSTFAIIGDSTIADSFTNNGTVKQGAFLSFDSANVVNNSLWLVNSSTITNFNGGTLVNNGILRNEGTADFLVRGGFINNGTIDAAGGTINYKGGIAFNDGTVFTGAFNNQLVFDAKFNGAISSTNLLLNGGVQTGTAAILSGTARLAGSRMAGDWTIANGSTFAITSDSTIAGNFINDGTVKQQSFLSLDSANVANNGLWLVNSSTTTNFNGGTLVNNGILRNEGTADFLVRGGFVNNGTIDAAVGTINYKGGVTFNSGTVFTGAGINETVFDAKFNGGISSTNLVMNGGNAIGTAAVLSGSARLASGGMVGDWSIANGSTLAIVGAGDKGFGGNIVNNGTVDWQQGTITLRNGNLLTNLGMMNISGASDQMQGLGTGNFVNRGLITKTGPGTTFISAPILNYGVIDIEGGTLSIPNSTTNSGVLEGIGSVALTGTLTNAGEIAPGGSGTGIGALTLQGGYAQTAAGILDIQLGAGGLSDIFRVAGATSLDGTLALFCASCSVHVGDIYTILDTGGALTGKFASTTAAGFNRGFAYTVLYDLSANSRVQVRIDNVGMPMPGVPEPATWAMMLLGFGVVGGAVRANRRRHGQSQFVALSD